MKRDKGNASPDAYFNRVYDETVNALTRFVISKCGNILDAEDILQNVYARFYQRISKKGWEDIENAEAFIVNIAKFECKTYYGTLKKHSKTDSFSEFSEEKMVAVEALPEIATQPTDSPYVVLGHPPKTAPAIEPTPSPRSVL